MIEKSARIDKEDWEDSECKIWADLKNLSCSSRPCLAGPLRRIEASRRAEVY